MPREFSDVPSGPPQRCGIAVTFLAFATLLTLPWLWPWAPGPSGPVVPLLAAWTCILLALATAGAFRIGRQDWLRAIPMSWLVAASASSVIALAQWFGVAPSWPFLSPAELAQAYGNLRQRNHFATLTSLGLLSIAWLAPGTRRCLPWIVLTSLLACGNAVSGSRTGLLQWIVLAVGLVAWPGDRRLRLFLAGGGLLAYALATALLPVVFEAVHGMAPHTAFGRLGADLGCSSRKILWGNVVHLILQRPWTGWGWGELDYAHYATLYPSARFCEILDNAHNLPLHLAVELGLPLALAVCALVVWIVVRARPWSEVEPPRQLAWLALAMVGVHALVEYPLWYGHFQLAVLLALGVLARPRSWSVAARRAALAGAGVGLLVLAAVSVDYATVSQAYLPPDQRRPAMRADPVGTAGQPWLFDAQLRFAELVTLDLTRANASHVRQLARDMLHYSPEPAVIEKLLDSTLILGDDEELAFHAARYKAAFPEQYRAWIASAARFRSPAAP